MSVKPSKDSRIAIIGAGPAGLSAGLYLKRSGYTDVTILEKLPRIGGLCLSITENYRTYDIGANYVTWQYTEVRKIAREVGAEMYFESPYTALEVPPDGSPTSFTSFLKAITTDAATGRRIPILRYLFIYLKYLFLRFKLGTVIDPPDFARVAERAPELMVPFSEWLSKHRIEGLTRLFEIPVTVMGYGSLDKIATPYVLKYIGIRTFIPMLFFDIPILRYIFPWPKRFVLGFQRMWEKVSWGLNVRTGIEIEKLERRADRIVIDFAQHEQIMNEIRTRRSRMEFDYVMLACPLCPEVIGGFMSLSEEEQALFGRIETHTYTMFVATVEGLHLPTPIAAVLPLTPIGTPWAVVQQWMSEGSLVTQFYVQVPGESCVARDDEKIRRLAVEAIRELVRQMGGEIVSAEEDWVTFDAFPYFQHVSVGDFAEGWYARLAALQGVDRTFYLGGATSFELIEPIVEYSKHIVGKHFPGHRTD